MAVDAAVIKRTQEVLSPYVKKPPLTEKLLNKPPFRFLHDVFTVIIKDTGVLEGGCRLHITHQSYTQACSRNMRWFQKT